MPEQLSFDLPVREALGRDDFFVSPANAEAVAMIEGWQDWPSRKLILIGPHGAGKTHLAHVWASLSGARILPGAQLSDVEIPDLASAHVAIEDVDIIAENRTLEDKLFHLHNLTLAEGNSLLLTASKPANLWPLSLPDLASRMQGTSYTTLCEPDDSLLSAVLMKLMSDRQLSPSPSVLTYLTRRIDRSFEAARDIVDQLDATALATGRPINRALAARVLDKRAE